MVSAVDRERRLRRLSWLTRGGWLLASAGLIWSLWPSQGADASYRPTVPDPAFRAWPPPRMAIDEAHFNVHRANGRFQPFARLAEQDGFRIITSTGSITQDTLRGADIFVTANAFGFLGVLQHVANLAGLERAIRLPVGAFSRSEVAALERWVDNGGRALIVADHAPAGLAAQGLAAPFGVEMTTWWAEDGSGVFSRSNGGLGQHPILDGRHTGERVDLVMTFTGQGLRPGPDGEILLRFSSTAREYPFRSSTETQGRSIAGLAQAVAVRHGRGRVVVVGEAAMMTAQILVAPDGSQMRIGMNRHDNDNQQFVLNVLRWLMGVLN
jgi:hypothetical protein